MDLTEEHSKHYAEKNTLPAFYAVYIPLDNNTEQHVSSYIFNNKLEAINLLKKHKTARFKIFQVFHDAVEFVKHGMDFIENPEDINSKTETTSNGLFMAEKPVLFKMPKSQDLVKFRKNIENNYLQMVYDTMWENPRYLVGNGDTPTILHEGFRYNALHVAARTKNWRMTDLLLNTISDETFVKTLYGEDCCQDAQERAKVLVDLYLNTPDKGLNETPLHFAAKFGAVEVVEVLVSFPMCDKRAKNKYGKTAAEIVCSRCNDANVTATKNKIAILLDDNFYVPLIRSETNCTEPLVGEPFSPRSPLNYNLDPLQPRLEIHAYAGPLTKEEANRFRKIWKTPPRSLKSNTEFSKDFDRQSRFGKFIDTTKEPETIGRELAAKYDIGWKEYWPFLETFVDIATPEGLEQLEHYLQRRTYDNHDLTFSSDKGILNGLSSGQVMDKSLGDKIGNSISVMNSFIEKACQLFSSRISNEILVFKDINCSTVCFDFSVNYLEELIEKLNKNHLEGIHSGEAHHRIGSLVANNLKEALKPHEIGTVSLKIQQWLINCNEVDKSYGNFDYTKQHTACLLNCVLAHIDNGYDTNDKDFENGKLCSCKWTFQMKNLEQNCNSFARRLNFENSITDLDNEEIELSLSSQDTEDVQKLDESSSDEEYFTPCSSPLLFQDNDEIYEDAVSPEYEIFTEGFYPTKTDLAVFKAIKRVDNQINPFRYPFIYKWRHSMRAFLGYGKIICPSPIREETNTVHNHNSSLSTPPKSWVRITGVHSPRFTSSPLSIRNISTTNN